MGILVSSTFLSRVSKVAIKVVGLRREHRARLLKRTNAKDDHDDQAAAPDDDDNADTVVDDDDAVDDDDDADAIYQHLQQYICRRFNLSPFWLSYIILYAVFVCRRRITTTVRKVYATTIWFPSETRKDR